MREADYIVDVGPGAGIHGGRLSTPGPPRASRSARSPWTGQYLSGKRKVEVPETRRPGSGKILEIKAPPRTT